METKIALIIFGLFKIFGSICIFLYGMKIMSEGIQHTAGDKLQRIIKLITNNRFTGVLTGFLITALIQSSSATTVMVVSFVNAGLLSLRQAIGVIMGANIGTTITGWLVTIFGFKVKISVMAIPVIGLGFPFLFSKKHKNRYIGEILIGFGLLFLGLEFMKESVPNIKDNPEVLYFLTNFTDLGLLSRVIFIVAGTIVTFVIQSSSAAMAVTLAMMHVGWIDFNTAAALILGQNIGTTITAYLASIGTNVNARRAARAHTLFNVFGVLLILFFFNPFVKFIDLIVPKTILQDPETHLAMFHTLFNIINTFVLIWFVKFIALAVERLVKPKERDNDISYKLPYISSGIQDTPEINIIKAKTELSKMAEITELMFKDFMNLFFGSSENNLAHYVDESKELEEKTDAMQEEISKYLVECSKENLNEISANNVNAMIRIVHELESIGDSCFNLVLLSQRMHTRKLHLPESAFSEIRAYSDDVVLFLNFNKNHLNEHLHRSDLNKAYDLESSIDNKRNYLIKSARKRLQAGSDVKSELLFIDIIKHLEHIGDYSLNIAQALRNIY